MAEQESSSKVEEEEKHPEMAADEQRAIFVDTNLDTHLAIPISPNYSISSLKRNFFCINLSKFSRYNAIEHLYSCPNCNFYLVYELVFLKFCGSINP